MPRRRSSARSGAYSRKRRTTFTRRPARRRASSIRQAPRRPAPLGLTSLSKTIRKVPFLMSHIDPFLPIVRGVKVPDSNTMESDTASLNDEFSMTLTSGANVKAILFNPAMTSTAVPSVEGAGAWAWPAAYGGGLDVNQLANVQAGSTAWRAVAHGIRISSTLAATAATGFVHIAVYAPGTYGSGTWPFPTTIAQMRDLPFYRKVTLSSLTQSPLTVVNKFLDQTAFRYSDTQEGSAGFSASGRSGFQVVHSWATIILAVEGAPTGTSLGIETTLHIETLAKVGGTNNSSRAAPGNPGLMAAAGAMAAGTPATHFESEQGSLFAQAGEAISEGLQAGAQGVAEWGATHLRNAARDTVYYGAAAVLNAVAPRGGRPRVGTQNVNGQYRLTN